MEQSDVEQGEEIKRQWEEVLFSLRGDEIFLLYLYSQGFTFQGLAEDFKLTKQAIAQRIEAAAKKIRIKILLDYPLLKKSIEWKGFLIERLPTRICPICNTIFKPTIHHLRFCTKKCRKIAVNRGFYKKGCTNFRKRMVENGQERDREQDL